jgi:tRNA(Arg) A34 adenosine deaminase TadA
MNPTLYPTVDERSVHTWLGWAHEVAELAKAQGHHPFGAVLVGPQGNVLMTQGNVDTVNHAEAVLARRAAERFTPQFLWHCTLVTTVEPCAMCAATQYWAHIGRVVYGMSEHRLLQLTGNHSDNPTLSLPCRDVFARGQKQIEVVGPVPALEECIASLHAGFWQAPKQTLGARQHQNHRTPHA